MDSTGFYQGPPALISQCHTREHVMLPCRTVANPCNATPHKCFGWSPECFRRVPAVPIEQLVVRSAMHRAIPIGVGKIASPDAQSLTNLWDVLESTWSSTSDLNPSMQSMC